jgi:hypothetical protein
MNDSAMQNTKHCIHLLDAQYSWGLDLLNGAALNDMMTTCLMTCAPSCNGVCSFAAC